MLKFTLVCGNLNPSELEREIQTSLFDDIKCFTSYSVNSLFIEFHQPLMTSGRAFKILNLVYNWLSVRHIDASIRDFSFE